MMKKTDYQKPASGAAVASIPSIDGAVKVAPVSQNAPAFFSLASPARAGSAQPTRWVHNPYSVTEVWTAVRPK
jgi:hypothetical protein